MERSGMSVRVWSLVCLLMAAAADVSVAQGQNCLVSDNEKMACGAPAISRADCEASNCCFDQRGRQPCYYSNEVTVQCTTDGQFVVVVPRNVTTPPLSLDTVSLLGGQSAPCSPVGTTAGFALFQFPVSACGSTLKSEGGDVVYENTMSSKRDVQNGPDGSITRDSYYELTFLCKYSGSELVPVEAVVYTAAPPPPSVVAPGPLSVELRIATEAVYASYYGDGDYPVTKVLRDPVYVEVRILNRTDPNIVLTLEDCWATSTPSPLGQPQWSLLVAGCPYRDDQYQTTLVPVAGSSGLPYPTHYKRFIVQMFTFVDAGSQLPLKEKVFIHCSAAVCQPSATDSCVAPCSQRMRRAVAPVQRASRETAVVSSGEVILTASELSAVDRRASPREVSQAFGYAVLTVAAFTVLVLCAVLLVAVWRSKPHRRETQL
ncbi:zona pellucida sperm-binding protein 4-like [Amia ocellicauda]|uniref:zona pellucida sperm-binding protein 4-like n=1 Tax=Amia ocellicauda TaxID=2972642 RepID=UPI0034644FC1